MPDPAPRPAAPAALSRGRVVLAMLRPATGLSLVVANDDGSRIGPGLVPIGRPHVLGIVRKPEISA